MIEQTPNQEELQKNYEALYERPVVDAQIEGINFDNPEDAKTRLVLGREVAPGISVAMEIDDDGLPRPNPFGRSAVRAVGMKNGGLNIGDADYGYGGKYFKDSGKRVAEGFSFAGGIPSMGYYEEHSGTFTFAADKQSMEKVDKAIDTAKELYEMTETKPFEERTLGPELTLDAAKQVALGIAERDYMQVNSRHSVRNLSSMAADSATTAFNIVGGFEPRPKDLNAPFMEDVKNAVYDQDVWKNLQNGRIQHPDIYIGEMQEGIDDHGASVQGMVKEVLNAAIKDDVTEILEQHKPDIEAFEAQERANYDAQQAKYEQQKQERKDAAAKEVVERFDAMLPEVVEPPKQEPRMGLKRKIAAAALAVTTAFGIGSAVHEATDNDRPASQVEYSAVPNTDKEAEKPQQQEAPQERKSIENKTDIVTINAADKSVQVELKEGGNPSFAARDAYRAEGIAEPSDQQIHESLQGFTQLSEAEARSLQPGTVLTFKTEKAEDGSVKLVAKDK